MGLFSNFSFLKRNAPEPAPAATPTPASAPEPASTPEAEPVPVVVEPAPSEPAVSEVSSQACIQAEEMVHNVAAELPNFLTVAIIDGGSGHLLAGQWAGDRNGEAEAAAANAELVHQARQAIEVLGLAPAEQVQDVLITLRGQLHLLQVLPQHGWLLYLAIRTQDTNLALARTVLRQHAA